MENQPKSYVKLTEAIVLDKLQTAYNDRKIDDGRPRPHVSGPFFDTLRTEGIVKGILPALRRVADTLQDYGNPNLPPMAKAVMDVTAGAILTTTGEQGRKSHKASEPNVYGALYGVATAMMLSGEGGAVTGADNAVENARVFIQNSETKPTADEVVDATDVPYLVANRLLKEE